MFVGFLLIARFWFTRCVTRGVICVDCWFVLVVIAISGGSGCLILLRLFWACIVLLWLVSWGLVGVFWDTDLVVLI